MNDLGSYLCSIRCLVLYVKSGLIVLHDLQPFKLLDSSFFYLVLSFILFCLPDETTPFEFWCHSAAAGCPGNSQHGHITLLGSVDAEIYPGKSG